MKPVFFALVFLFLSESATAQQQHKYPRSPAVVETYRDSSGKVKTRRRVTAVPERRTTTRWRYHKGYKRASELPAARPDAGKP